MFSFSRFHDPSLILGLFYLSFCGSGISAQLRDGGIDPANLGKGDWIYILPNAINQLGGNAPAVSNLSTLMAYEKNLGVQYLIIKAADGSALYPSAPGAQFTSAVVNAGHAAGLKIFGYNRSNGTNILGEVAIADYVFTNGADGFVFDAEAEWESAHLPNNTSLATQLCSIVRSNWPNKFLAHSPFAFISGHGTFPYKEFGYYCDVAMPQDYWIEFGMTATATVDRMDTDWKNWQAGLTGKWTNSLKPLVPVGQAWSSGNGTITPAQITEFVSALKNDASPATAGGYKGVNYWRAELHPADVLDAIKTNNIGNVSTNPPTVSNVSAGNLTAASAVMTWTTDQSSDSEAEYGLTTSYGTGATNTSAVYYHTVTLTGLSPNTTYHAKVESKNPAGQIGASADYVFTTPAATVADIIVDDANVTYVGSWSVGTATSGYSGTEYRFSSTAVGGTSLATYRPSIATSGNYDIYIWYIAGSNRATNAPYVISYNGGTFSLMVDQSINGGGWYKIASSKNFLAGTSGYVQFSNNTGASGKVVIADACKLVYLPPPASPPSIGTPPQNIAVNQGNTANFNVVASGTSPLSYQWRFGGVNIPGATSTAYSKLNAQLADQGNYTVVVTNSVSGVTSAIATLTVYVPPGITSQPQSQTVAAGTNVTFSLIATGTAPLGYQWQFNDLPIPGATSDSYTRTNVQPGDAGNYSIIVSNIAGTLASDEALLTVAQPMPPRIDTITLLPDQSIQLQISGGPGNFAIDAAPDLSGWSNLTNLTAAGAVFYFTDTETNLPARFYRVRVLP